MQVCTERPAGFRNSEQSGKTVSTARQKKEGNGKPGNEGHVRK